MAPQIRGTAAAETTLETAASKPVTTAPKAIDTEEVYDLTQALPPVAKKPSAAFTSLARLLPTRRPELRRAKQDEVRPARGVPNLSRMSNREATVAQSVGAPAPSPCGLCAKGGGLWTSCVVVAGFLRGSCANCHYGGNGFKCTFRQAGKASLLLFSYYKLTHNSPLRPNSRHSSSRRSSSRCPNQLWPRHWAYLFGRRLRPTDRERPGRINPADTPSSPLPNNRVFAVGWVFSGCQSRRSAG
jgi:hypothetical protein